MRILFLSALAILFTATDGGAIGRRRSYVQQQPVYYTPLPVESIPTTGTALDEVNAARARRGLRPYLHDPDLERAALGCAHLRATYRIAGHLANDFAALPPGTRAGAAGCAAWEPEFGWGACTTYENWIYAGAAVVVGTDSSGRTIRYMHIFVR